MNKLELAELVLKTRTAQRMYFRTRTQGDLRESIRLEKELDAAAEKILKNGQPGPVGGAS